MTHLNKVIMIAMVVGASVAIVGCHDKTATPENQKMTAERQQKINDRKNADNN